MGVQDLGNFSNFLNLRSNQVPVHLKKSGATLARHLAMTAVRKNQRRTSNVLEAEKLEFVKRIEYKPLGKSLVENVITL